MKYVARQTGLSMHTIRVWEKRYGAVRPARDAHQRRLYADAEVERLRLLRDATQAGHSIGQIANASMAELRRLVRADLQAPEDGASKANTRGDAAVQFSAAAIESIRRLDHARLHRVLETAAVELGSPALLQNVIAAVARRVGDLWREGELGVVHEHFATAIITEFLTSYARPFAENANGPQLLVATPPGQLHELGAIIIAAAARSHGWRSTYLGASLPIEELLRAAQELKPRAIGLSIVYPPEDETLRKDFARLRKLLPKSCTLFIGGHSAGEYLSAFGKNGAIYVRTLEEFYPQLEKAAKGRDARGRH